MAQGVCGPRRAVSPQAGAVVVNYNARDYLLDCLDSLLAEGAGPVVVADNSSSDGSEEAVRHKFPQVRWLATGANLGYGGGANLGAASIDSELIVVCNPDLVAHPGALSELCRYLDEVPSVGLVGPAIYNVDGSLYPSARRFPDLVDSVGHGFLGQFWPSNPFSRRYRMTNWDHAQSREVDWVSGAFFVVRRSAWQAVGGFDPAFYMYLEDVDLCWRLRQAGWGVAYVPGAAVTHVQGVSADRHPYRMLAAHHVSMWRFAWRTTEPHRRWSLGFVAPGLALRFVLTAARRAASGTKPPARVERSTGPRPAK